MCYISYRLKSFVILNHYRRIKMIDSDAEVRVYITCDVCGNDIDKVFKFNTMDTDYISIHELEDKQMKENNYTIESNIVRCGDCKDYELT